MPAHLLYFLQPLNISCFLVLKQLYRHLVEQLMGCRVNHINKCEFLPLYRQARQVALYQNNIQAGFAVTGLVLYSPNRVLAQLHTKYQTPLPQHRLQLNASWTAETPYNIAELQQRTAFIRRYFKEHMYSLLSPTGQAFSQLVKGYKMAILSAILLASENEKLYMGN